MPRAPVQAPPPVAQIPPPDPAIVPVLRQIESYRGRCAQERVGIGDEQKAIVEERFVATAATSNPDWREQLPVLAVAQKVANGTMTIGGLTTANGRYTSCLFAAHQNALRTSSPLTADEIAGQRIVKSIGNACASERSAAERDVGSRYQQEYNDLKLYKVLADNTRSGDSMTNLNESMASLTGRNGWPGQATKDYWHCVAQARLAQMDGGSAALRGGGRESGAHEPDRPGTVIASAPQNPYPKQSGDKNYLTEDGKPCITAQALPTEVHDDGWRNYVIEYTNVCPRIIVIYSRWIQDGPLWNTDGVQSGGIGEGSKSKPAKMGANCVNDPKHKANACTGYSEWWVK